MNLASLFVPPFPDDPERLFGEAFAVTATHSSYPIGRLALPGNYFDVWTFEVKPPDSWDITVVHEALAHARFATRPYALVVLPPSLHEDPHQDLRFVECVKAARKHGVGFMTVDKPSDFETWVTWVEAERHEPDPQLTHDFLTQQLSDRALDSAFELLTH